MCQYELHTIQFFFLLVRLWWPNIHDNSWRLSGYGKMIDSNILTRLQKCGGRKWICRYNKRTMLSIMMCKRNFTAIWSVFILIIFWLQELDSRFFKKSYYPLSFNNDDTGQHIQSEGVIYSVLSNSLSSINLRPWSQNLSKFMWGQVVISTHKRKGSPIKGFILYESYSQRFHSIFFSDI